jgi:hypothetical protein
VVNAVIEDGQVVAVAPIPADRPLPSTQELTDPTHAEIGATHRVLRLRGGADDLEGDIIDDWEAISRLPYTQSLSQQRSPALQEIDRALDRWKNGSRRTPGEFDQNERELQDIQDAIHRYWEFKNGTSKRDAAINHLEERIRQERADVQDRRARSSIRYDVSPQNWPTRLTVKRSATGYTGVYFVSGHDGNSVAVKPMSSVAPTFYADNFIRRVGGVATPYSQIYGRNSPDGQALYRIFSNAVDRNEIQAGDLDELDEARHYLVMEMANGKPLSSISRDQDLLMAMLRDRKAMRDIARLIVIDSFLGNADRLIYPAFEYSNRPEDRGNPLNLDNIMYSPDEGIIAIDNDFSPVGHDADQILRSTNLKSLRALGHKKEIDNLANLFLRGLEITFRETNNVHRRQRIEALESTLEAARRHITDGIYRALSEVGARAIEEERALEREQLARFPGSPSNNWFIGGLASYARWRFNDINATRKASLSHEEAAHRLREYVQHRIGGQIFVGQRAAERHEPGRGHDLTVFSQRTVNPRGDRLNRQALDQAIANKNAEIKTLKERLNDPDLLNKAEQQLNRLQRVRATWDLSSRRPGRDAAHAPGGSTDGRSAANGHRSAPHIDHDDGIAWASSARSARTPDGRLIPPDQRSCVSVAVLTIG